jgi:hypothetical protein
VTDSKPSTLRTVGLASALAAAVLLATATGGMGLWARDGKVGGDATGPALFHAQRGGAGMPGQRSSQQPRRPQVDDLLPPIRFRWWQDAEVQKTVGLTPEKVQRLDALFNERNEELAPFIREFFLQRDELRRMAGERRVSPEEFAIQAARFQSLAAKLDESRNIMLYRMSRELSDEQYTKLQEVRDRRSRGGGRVNPPNR